MLVLSGQEQGRPHSCICKIRIALLRCLRCLSRWGFSPAGQLLGWSDLEGPPSAFLTISFPLYHPFLYPFDTRKKRVGRAVIRTGTQKRKKKKKSPMLRKGGRYQTTFSADPAFHRKPFHRMSLSHSYVVGRASGLNCCPKNWLWHLVLPQPQCYSDEISGNTIEDTQRMPN